VNLSDLAAMGASPRAALLSLVLPDMLEVATIDGVLDGLLALAARYRVALVGGNITRSPGPFVIDVTVTGAAKPRRVLTRAGARPGDDVYVTGTIGDAAVGLRSLRAGYEPDGIAEAEPDARVCEQRYLRPEPRLRAGMLLGRIRAASSCVDLSDGLADGVRQIAEASKVGMVLDGASVPISGEASRWHARRGQDALEASLAGGDDYELLFTVRPTHRGRLRAVEKEIGGLPITRIGVVTRDQRLIVRGREGDRDLPAGFEHFR
jgi:thiamine-monophosphate kinase